jgi:hypothetical protein
MGRTPEEPVYLVYPIVKDFGMELAAAQPHGRAHAAVAG